MDTSSTVKDETDTGPTEKDAADWLEALRRENCVAIKDLLKKTPRLINVGWKENPLTFPRLLSMSEYGEEDDGRRANRDNCGRTALHVAARRGCVDLVRQIFDLFNDRGNGTERDRKWRRDLKLEDLLAAFDGYYRLDAFAMAIFNGNVDTIGSLSDVITDGHMDLYETTSEDWPVFLPDSPSSEVDRSKIQLITVATMENLPNPEQILLKDRYACDDDFEDLPWEQYLFHFICVQRENELSLEDPTGIAIKIATNLMERVSETPRSCQQHLFSLRDRKGRTVLDVAASHGNVEAFFKVITLNPDYSFIKNAYEYIAEAWSRKEDAKQKLREITEATIANCTEPERELLKNLYASDYEFNFLPLEEFLFHFIFGKKKRDLPLMWERRNVPTTLAARIAEDLVRRAWENSASTLCCLFSLRDGQGRTPVHVAVTHHTVDEFLPLIPEGAGYRYIVNAFDGVGRTPLNRVAAIGGLSQATHMRAAGRLQYTIFLAFATKMNARVVGKVSRRNGLSNHVPAGHTTLSNPREQQFDRDEETWAEEQKLYDAVDSDGKRSQATSIHLALLTGNLSALGQILQDQETFDWGRNKGHEQWKRYGESIIHGPVKPGLHVAAYLGNVGAVKMFLDHNSDFDPLAVDDEGNTALHAANRQTAVGILKPSLLDFCDMVDCARFKERYDLENKKREGHRKGIVNLLLEAGIDIWQTNDKGQVPSPAISMSEGFTTWWYERKSRETTDLQGKLNVGANAISLIGALVATASYIGPLQPPLGYSDADRVRVTIRGIRIFIVCNTLSFYLAVAALIFAVIPSIALPLESTLDELNRTRKVVIVAIGCLIPSIVSILVAFGAASISVIPDDHSWNYGGLTASTTIISGLVCAIGVILFCIRLLRLIFYKNMKIRKLYKDTTFERNTPLAKVIGKMIATVGSVLRKVFKRKVS